MCFVEPKIWIESWAELRLRCMYDGIVVIVRGMKNSWQTQDEERKAIDKNWFALFNRISLCFMFIACTVWIPMWFEVVQKSTEHGAESEGEREAENSRHNHTLSHANGIVFISTCVGMSVHHLQLTYKRFHFASHLFSKWKQNGYRSQSAAIHLISYRFSSISVSVCRSFVEYYGDNIFHIWKCVYARRLFDFPSAHNLFMHITYTLFACLCVRTR